MLRARCGVRLVDLAAEAHRIHLLEKRCPADLEVLAARLDRLRASIERYASEMDWLSQATRESLRKDLAETDREIAALRRAAR